MEKTNKKIPTTEELNACIKESVVSVTDVYEQPPVVLMVGDATIGTLGNFSASIGKAKSKKDFQCIGYCCFGIVQWHSTSLSGIVSRRQTENSLYRHRTGRIPLQKSLGSHFTNGRFPK